MDAYVVQAGARADAPPGPLKVRQMAAQQPTGDDPGIVLAAGQGFQHRAGLGAERHSAPARLRVGQLDAVVPDVVPAQGLDFRQAAAGEQRKADRGDGGRHLRLRLAQDLAQPFRLLRREEPSTAAPS